METRPSLQKELHDIATSLQIMKRGLHGWDNVDNQIDDKLEAVEAELKKASVDPAVVEGFRQDRERLWKLTAQERTENIENAERVLPWLKGIVLGGAVTTAGLGAAFVVPALAPIFNVSVRSLSLLKTFFWGNSWRTHIPWAAAYLTSAATFWKSSQDKAAPFWKPKHPELPYPDLNDSRYQRSTESYICLVHHLLGSGPNEAALPILFDHAQQSGNPEIQEVFSQLFYRELNKPGAFVTMYRKNHSPNFCLNFTPELQNLPCELGSHDFMGASRFSPRWVENYFFNDFENDSADWAKKAADFPVNQARLTPEEGLDLLVKKHGSPTLVQGILQKVYRNLHLPEGVAAVNYILLNLFMKSDQISADAKLLYAGLVRASLAEYQEAMAEKIETLRGAIASFKSEPQFDTQTGEFYLKSPVEDPEAVIALMEELRVEKESVLKALSAFETWALKYWSAEFHAEAQNAVREAKEEIETVYGDFERIRYHLFYNEDYLGRAQENYWTLLGAKKDGQIVGDGYMVRSRSISDVWRSEVSAEGALWGGIAGAIGLKTGLSAPAREIFRTMGFWKKALAYAPWIVSGLIVYPNATAIASAYAEAGPLPWRNE